MFSEERYRITRELEMLLNDYWHDIDTNWGRNAGQFYTDDAIFEASRSIYRGREQIQQFYDFRLSRGPRVAMHSVTNFRAIPESPTRATTTWYLLLFAHDGAPIQASAPPIQISLMTDICVKCDDGQWRYQHRKFEVWFQGGVETTSMDVTSANGSGAVKGN